MSTRPDPAAPPKHRPPARPQIIVVGAGPVGLTIALGLARRDVAVTLVEHEPALTTDLRAGSFHPPTLEALEALGVARRFLDIGIRVPRWQIRDRRTGVVAEFDLGLLADVTPYPFRFHCEQFKLTPLLLEDLRRHPHATVRFATSFETVRQTDDEVIATVSTADGREEIRGAYPVGADGGRSVVRKMTRPRLRRRRRQSAPARPQRPRARARQARPARRSDRTSSVAARHTRARASRS